MKFKFLILILLLIGIYSSSRAQLDTLNKKRLTTVLVVEGTGYLGVMSGLYYLWYKDEASSSFQTINDNSSWEQLDKVGHSVTSFYVGKVGYEALRWSGVERKKSIWYGGTLGLFFLTSVEVLDGFSAGWGFSWGDVAANSFGTGLFIGQQMAWNEQRLLLKYSFHTTEYADLRPNLLGENFVQQTIKDYNGQTYWLSTNISAFLGKDNSFPKWLNFAVGYGADGLVGSIENQFHPDIQRQRQYYVSLDVDLTRIKTNNKFLKTFFQAFGFLKFPMPTLEFNQHGDPKFYPFYF